MPDVWEKQHGLDKNVASDANIDADSDGLTNLEEYQLGINPQLKDSDGDGMNDKEEVDSGRNPNDSSDGTNIMPIVPILELLLD